jgi:hypothetical protein
VSSGDKNEEENDNSNGAGSHEALCNDPYYNCSCHKKNRPPPSPPPLPTIGGYLKKGNTICYVGILLGLTYFIHMLRPYVCCFI